MLTQNWNTSPQKSCMKQSFGVGYMVDHDTSSMLYTTKLHRVAKPLLTADYQPEKWVPIFLLKKPVKKPKKKLYFGWKKPFI